MNLSSLFIRRPVMTILAMLTIGFFGIVSYQKLAVSDLPSVEYPTIAVSVIYPGADPETIANNVVVPLEKEFMAIQGVNTISSTSYNGQASIVLQFVLEKSIDLAAPDVQQAINAASSQLPPDLPFAPTYAKVNPTANPILYLAFTSSTMTLGDLYQYGNTFIGQRLSMIDGVAQVSTYGQPYAVRVQVDVQKLAAKGIGIDEVGNALLNNNVYLPTGTLFGHKTESTMNVDGQLFPASQYETLIIKQENGAIVRLRDVARCLDSLQNDKYYLQHFTKESDHPAVILAIQKRPGANTIAVIDKISKHLSSLEKELPGSVTLHRVFSSGDYIEEAILDVEHTLLIAIGLVVIVIFVYLGKIKDTIIPAIAIPLSILGTFIAMFLLDYTIDILSLLAMTLAIGFLVDDAIVVLENVVRHIEMGAKPFDAALQGSKEISFTILSMTLSLASVFIPLLFMPGIIGRILHEFGMVIVIAILMSGFISLSLTPLLCSKFVKSNEKAGKKNHIEQFSDRLNVILVRFYQKTLEWTLKRTKTALAIALVGFLVTLWMFFSLPKDFIPNDDIGFISGFTQTEDGTSPYEMMRLQAQICEIVRKDPRVETVIGVAATSQDNQGAFYARLTPVSQRASIQSVIQDLYEQLREIPGVQTFMRPIPLINLDVGTSQSKGDYQLTVQSLDEKQLYKYTNLLMTKIAKIPGIGQVTSNLDIKQPQANLHIVRDKASMLNVSAQNVENTLNLAFAGTLLSPIYRPSNQYYAILEVLPKFYRDPSVLSQLWVRSMTGQLVPLNEITQLKEDVSPLTVNHSNGLPSATVSFNLKDVALGSIVKDVSRVCQETLPSTVFANFQGTADIFRSSFSSMGILSLITLFLVYVILGILYEDFLPPLTVMSTLPPAALGAFLSLIITQSMFSLYAFVGVMMLLGIVMKNGIIMVDFATVAQKEGKTPEEAILHACMTRFRPIIMTTLAAMMGAMPIALGLGGSTADTRRPLGFVIVGGLIFSQLITLYLTPVIYVTIEKMRKNPHANHP